MSHDDDDGMTVVELLIAIVIMVMIMAPLATSFVIGMSTTRGSELDAGGSADAQLLAGAFDVDIASATAVTAAAAMTCGSGQGIVQLTVKDGTLTRYIGYRATADAARQAELQLPGAVYVLERFVCSDAGGTVADRQVLARTLKSVPSVACDGKPSCPATPRRVMLTTVSYATQTPDSATPGQYTASVTATRKVTP